MYICTYFRLASGGWDKFVYVWEVETGKVLVRIPLKQTKLIETCGKI